MCYPGFQTIKINKDRTHSMIKSLWLSETPFQLHHHKMSKNHPSHTINHHCYEPSINKNWPKEWATALALKHLLVSWDLWTYQIGFKFHHPYKRGLSRVSYQFYIIQCRYHHVGPSFAYWFKDPILLTQYCCEYWLFLGQLIHNKLSLPYIYRIKKIGTFGSTRLGPCLNQQRW